MKPDIFTFCPYCSNRLVTKTIHSKKLLFCQFCNKNIFMHTPQTAAAIITNDKMKLLLVKRRNEPLKGLWSLPAGFIEYGENPIDAAIREVNEETGLKLEFEKIVGIYLADDHPKTFSILTVISAKNVEGKYRPKDDASEVMFFEKDCLPPMAFSAQTRAIKDYFQTKS